MIFAKRNTEIKLIFSVLDADGKTPKSGQADFIEAILRDEDGLAEEQVAIAEQENSGFYEASFTPRKSSADGFLYRLEITEPTGTLERTLSWDIQVFPSISYLSADGNFLTTLHAVKQYLEIAADSYDELLENLIARAGAMIQIKTGRTLTPATLTEDYDGRGSKKLLLREYPIIALYAVYDDLDREFSDETLVDPSYYYVDEKSGAVEMTRGWVFSKGRKNIRVHYRAGFSAIPADLENACILLVAHLFKMRRDIGVSSRSLKDGSISYTREIPDEVKEIISKYGRQQTG